MPGQNTGHGVPSPRWHIFNTVLVTKAKVTPQKRLREDWQDQRTRMSAVTASSLYDSEEAPMNSTIWLFIGKHVKVGHHYRSVEWGLIQDEENPRKYIFSFLPCWENEWVRQMEIQSTFTTEIDSLDRLGSVALWPVNVSPLKWICLPCHSSE